MTPRGKAEERFDQGIEQVVAAVLASPNFLYRGIRGTPVADVAAQHGARSHRS